MKGSKNSGATGPRLYLAGPLFSEAEIDFNHRLKKLLLPFFDVYLPQEDGGLMVDMIAQGTKPIVAAAEVFATDVAAIEGCDVLLIVLDGRSIDEGAAFELGFAFAQGKPCYGLKTDPRQLLVTGNNPMIDCALRMVFSNVDALLAWARSLGLEADRDFQYNEIQALHV